MNGPQTGWLRENKSVHCELKPGPLGQSLYTELDGSGRCLIGVLSRQLPGGTEGNCEKLQSR
jgi:hypothetical protein